MADKRGWDDFISFVNALTKEGLIRWQPEHEGGNIHDGVRADITLLLTEDLDEFGKSSHALRVWNAKEETPEGTVLSCDYTGNFVDRLFMAVVAATTKQ